MFEKFGEFDSAEELNKAAAAQLEQGDTEAVITIAVENGLDREDAEDYIDGIVPELTTPLMAAMGKIKVECDELKPQQIMEDWVEYIKVQCTESDEMSAAVRRKGKSIKGCIAELLKWSFANQMSIEEDILKVAGVNASRVKLGIPGMGEAKKIIREYYGK